MIDYQPLQAPQLTRIDGGPNGRRYKTPEGNLYPSVTTIFSLNKSALDDWRKKVGEEAANKISARAAHQGTFIHKLCEDVIKGQAVDPGYIYRDLWNGFRPVVEQITTVFASETPLYSDIFKVAGTIDCLGYWQGELSIIDFKTSRSLKKREYIKNYFMQEAAYSVMVKERFGLDARKLVTLIAVENEEPQVFVERRDDWLPSFVDLRKQYKAEVGD